VVVMEEAGCITSIKNQVMYSFAHLGRRWRSIGMAS